jgi:hypothetical protein
VISVYGAGVCGGGTSYSLYDVIPASVPNASFALSSHVVNTGVNDLVTYTGTASSLGTYTWAFGGGAATPGTGAGPNWVNWATPGLKTITLSVTDSGCASTVFSDTVLVVVPTGNDNLSEDNHPPVVVPNPNSGNFTLIFDKPVSGPISVDLVDELGRTILRNNYASASDNKVYIVAAGVETGLYTAIINVSGIVTRFKIVISK